MEDVIFAGTAKRAGLGRAEVALTIDNSAGLLPIDFSEVRLTRTLWRTGESEYSINGAPCRLLDVQELLSDTGVGRQQHTIISQSQLDSILSARAEDRRAVIEEAAALSKDRRRKEKAERRLEATEGLLLRHQDLLKEDPQASSAPSNARPRRPAATPRLWLSWWLCAATCTAASSTPDCPPGNGRASTKSELGRAEEPALSALGRLDAAVVAAEGAP